MIKKIPLSSSGIVFSFAVLGNLFAGYSKNFGLAFTVVSVALYLVFILRLFKTGDTLSKELEHPNAMAFFSNFAMASTLIGLNIYPYSARIGYYLWYFGLISQGLMIIYFIMKYFINLDLKNLYPSLFLLFCGISTTAISGQTFGNVLIAQRCFYFAAICYSLLLPALFYRIFIKNEFEDELMPTITLTSFPSSILLAGYITTFNQPHIYVLIILLIFSGITYIFALSQAQTIFKSNSKFVTSIAISTSVFALSFKLANEHFMKVQFTYNLVYGVYIAIFVALVALAISLVRIAQCIKNRMNFQ